MKGRKKNENKLKSNHYVNNEEMLQVLIEYKANPTKKLYNTLGKMIMKISEHAIMAPSFMNYTNDRKIEMISDANYLMVHYCIKKFNPEVSNNPFAYFSQATKNAFLLYIKNQKRKESIFSNLSYIDHLEDSDMGGSDE